MNKTLDFIANLMKEPNTIVWSIFLFILSFAITFKMIPVIFATVNYKNLMDNPNERSSHIIKTPTLGGIAFYGSLIICIFFIERFDLEGVSLNLIVAITILFFLGLKDDLMVLSSRTKVFLQSAAILFIIFNPDLQIATFHGFLEIKEIPTWLSLGFGYFMMLYIINAYNLMDGIDGLAALLGILISAIFTLFFFNIGLYYYAFIGIILMGFLIAFLRYNLSITKKIFMGDTGSMIVGFLIGILTLRFLVLDGNQLQQIKILPENVFIIVLAILFFPAIDVIRVIFMRLLKGKGAFAPDRAHMHHIFIDKGLSHSLASITLTISGIITFILIYTINNFTNYIGLTILFILISFFTFYLLLLLDKDEKSRTHRKRMKKYIPKQLYRREFRLRKFFIVFLKRIFFKDLL